MMYVYILHSESLSRYYTGQSMYHGKRRREHLREKKHWTSQTHDWKEVFCQQVETREQARALEVKIKKRGAKRFLSDLIG
jgi:putative endonuclease